MSDQSGPAASEAGKPSTAGKPSLFDRLRSLFGLGGASIRDDIEDAIEDASPEDDISAQERALLKNVLSLDEVHVGDLMVPRADIAAVPLKATLAELLAVFRSAGHSRLPVYGESLDDPRGMVHIRDYVAFLAEAVSASRKTGEAPELPAAESGGPARSLSAQCCVLDAALSETAILREVLFVPPSMRALDLLVKMQMTRTHLALVIDEYGGTEGLVSIEDIVEVIVGDIEDEHDLEETPKIETAPGGAFIADARAGLAEVSRACGADLSAVSDAEEVDTLGGLIITLAGHVPSRGEVIKENGFEFEVLDADPRRVKRVKLRLAGGSGAPHAAAGRLLPGELGGQSRIRE